MIKICISCGLTKTSLCHTFNKELNTEFSLAARGPSFTCVDRGSYCMRSNQLFGEGLSLLGRGTVA